MPMGRCRYNLLRLETNQAANMGISRFELQDRPDLSIVISC